MISVIVNNQMEEIKEKILIGRSLDQCLLLCISGTFLFVVVIYEDYVFQIIRGGEEPADFLEDLSTL